MVASIADLVAFLKRFHRHWLADPSLDPSLIPTDLPPGLATLYRELGALIAMEPGPDHDGRLPFAAQDALVPLSQLTRVDGMVEFAWENQGNWSARCPLGQLDPPVYSDAPRLWNLEQRGFVVVCPSLNHFLTTLCLQEAVLGSRHLAALQTDRPPQHVLTVPVRPLWLNGYYVAEEADHDFFVTPDGDTLVMVGSGIWVGSPIHPVADLIIPGIGIRVRH